MKNKTLSTLLQGNYRNSLGEFSTTSYEAARVIDWTVTIGMCVECKCMKCNKNYFVPFMVLEIFDVEVLQFLSS